MEEKRLNEIKESIQFVENIEKTEKIEDVILKEEIELFNAYVNLRETVYDTLDELLSINNWLEENLENYEYPKPDVKPIIEKLEDNL